MLDTDQLREVMGDDMIQFLKQNNKGGTKTRMYGNFPSNGNPWGYGIGATLINWNYDVANGEAVEPNVKIDDRCKKPEAT
jgi:hypothetical protein